MGIIASRAKRARAEAPYVTTPGDERRRKLARTSIGLSRHLLDRRAAGGPGIEKLDNAALINAVGAHLQAQSHAVAERRATSGHASIMSCRACQNMSAQPADRQCLNSASMKRLSYQTGKRM